VVFLIQLPGIAGGCFTGFQVGIAYCLVLAAQYRESYNKYNKIEPRSDIHVVFLIQLPGIAGGCFTGLQVGIAYCLVLGAQYRKSYNKYDKIKPLTSMWCS
jgi:hypothetical protein